MDEFMKKLKAYIYANPPDFGDGDAESILEMIHWYYAECNPFHTQEIKDGFADLNDYMEGLPIKDNDAVFSLVCRICAEYQRLAFIAGFHVGFRLEQEFASE